MTGSLPGAVEGVPGLYIWEDFCTEEEEAALVSFLDDGDPPWTRDLFGVPVSYGSKHFGRVVILKPQREVRLPDTSAGEVDLPKRGILGDLIRRFGDAQKPWGKVLKSFFPNEANVNDYRKEEKPILHMHWDDRGIFEDKMASISILGGATWTFSKGGYSNLGPAQDYAPGGQNLPSEQSIRKWVPRRSLILLSGAARYEWQHGIPNTEDFAADRRIAIVFRSARLTSQKPAVICKDEAALPAVLPLHNDEGRALVRALIISTNWPDPDVSAAGIVTCSRIAMLKEHGLSVYFACPNRPGTVQKKLAKSNGIQCVRIVINDEDCLVGLLQQSRPQIIIFDGFNAEERFGHYCQRHAPEAMRLLDMQDFHALRLGREALIAKGAGFSEAARYRPDAGSEDLLRELAALHRCDLSLAISEDECSLLGSTYGIPLEKVTTAFIGYDTPPKALEKLPGFEDRQHAMFIGNWRHNPNRDCAHWLAKVVWPKVRERLPHVELRIYGSTPTPEDMALTNKETGVTVCGYCKSVPSTMQSHRLLVAPLRYGAGVKGKITDAMRNGLVSVTTMVGAEGLGCEESFTGILVLGAESSSGESVENADADAFAKAVAEVYENQDMWTSSQVRSHAFVSEKCDSHANNKVLWDTISKRWEVLPEVRAKDFTGQMLWQSSLRSTEWMAKGLALKEELKAAKKQASLPKANGVEKNGSTSFPECPESSSS